MVFHPSRFPYIHNPKKHGTKHGGSLNIKDSNQNQSISPAQNSFFGVNVKFKAPIIDPAKNAKSFPLASGSRESNGVVQHYSDHLGGALSSVTFGSKKKKNEKVKLKI